jgi:hypothetical protein
MGSMNESGTDRDHDQLSQVWPHRLVGGAALALFLWAYVPSARIPFRVEQWDFYDFYQSYAFDVTSLHDWGLMAFWTPFGDFRPIPLAYLWNFLIFKILGNLNLWHWVLSLALTVLNALLLARWVSALRRHRGFDHGLIAAALFLLMPAKHEVVMWTFFTYKLAYTALVLASLILVERYLVTGGSRSAYLATGLLAVSWLFYEASIPIALVLPLRMVMAGRPFAAPETRRILASLGAALAGYGAFYLVTANWIPKAFDLVKQIPRQLVSFGSLSSSLWRWFSDGILLANAGLPFTSVMFPYHVGFRVVFELAPILLVTLVWGGLLLQLRWRPLPLRDLAYLGVVAGAGSVLVWVGRTMTNGPGYLASFSVYQHFPTLILAATLGYLVDHSDMRKRLLIAVLLVCVLLGISSRQAVDEYMHAQEPLIQALKMVENALRHRPRERVYVGDIRLPLAPTWSIPSSEHSYHAFHLLHGDRIARERPPAR